MTNGQLIALCMTSRCHFCGYHKQCDRFREINGFRPFRYPIFYKSDTPEEKKFKMLMIR